MSQVQATMGITADSMSTVDGQSVNTMDTLSELAKKMGSETAFSASECAQALNYLALAGYDTQEMCDTLPTVLNLAAADLSSVNALLANTGETWDSLQSSITNSAGAAQQMADTQLDNLQGQLTILKSALEGLAISFGELLMPAIKSIVGAIQGFVDWLNSMDEGTKKVIVTIALVVAAIGPVLIIVLDVQVIGTGSILRTAVIFFYISNEGVSLLENAAHLGLPVPAKMKAVLEQLHDKSEKCSV